MFKTLLGALALCALAALPAFGADSRMNPDLSVNALMLGRYGSRGADPAATDPDSLGVQEMEAQVAADIDPYLRGAVTVAAGPDGLGGWEIEPEEAYVESLFIPALALKAGKFKAALGRHNTLHLHAFPFIDAPLASQAILGGEGFAAPGASASLLLPLPYFAELSVQGFNAQASALFGSPYPGDLAGLGSLRQLWDLSEEGTLEIQGSSLGGRNASDDLSWLGNASASFKWRGSDFHALTVQAEWVHAETQTGPEWAVDGGASAWAQWQFARRWWLQGRGEVLGLGGPAWPRTRKYSALLGLFPSEFSGLRLQYDWMEAAVGDPEHRISVQLNVTMGVHPAHSY